MLFGAVRPVILWLWSEYSFSMAASCSLVNSILLLRFNWSTNNFLKKPLWYTVGPHGVHLSRCKDGFFEFIDNTNMGMESIYTVNRQTYEKAT